MHSFDELAKILASPMSRRHALKYLLGAAFAGTVALTPWGRRVIADRPPLINDVGPPKHVGPLSNNVGPPEDGGPPIHDLGPTKQ